MNNHPFNWIDAMIRQAIVAAALAMNWKTPTPFIPAAICAPSEFKFECAYAFPPETTNTYKLPGAP